MAQSEWPILANAAENVFRSGLPRFGPEPGGGATVYSRNGTDPHPSETFVPGGGIGTDGRREHAVGGTALPIRLAPSTAPH